jgi:hypothetical protein
VLSDEYQNGALTVNGIARRKTAKKITGKSNGQKSHGIGYLFRRTVRQKIIYTPLVVMEVVQRNVKLIE